MDKETRKIQVCV